MHDISPGDTQTPPALTGAVARLLQPLVRLLISHRFTYPQFGRLLKKVYVATADKYFRLPDKEQTISRIHLLTGVHRKDVKALLSADQQDAGPAADNSSLGALLISRWTADPRYLDKNGQPLPLPRSSAKTRGMSFAGLAEEMCTNVRPRAILDEWQRLGVVRVDNDDLVHLNIEAFVPERGFDEKAYFLGENVRAHLAACTRNLLADGAPEPERNVYYDNLTPAAADELRRLAEKEGMKALQAVNRRALELQQKDKNLAEARQRIRFGFYWHQGEEEDT